MQYRFAASFDHTAADKQALLFKQVVLHAFDIFQEVVDFRFDVITAICIAIGRQHLNSLADELLNLTILQVFTPKRPFEFELIFR